jgi:chromosome segregation ATPase
MKKIFVMVLAGVAMVACTPGQKGSQETAMQQLRDSLNRIIEQKDTEIDDMMGTLNEIEEGFRAINEAEQRVTIAKDGEGATSAARIRENMQYITERMQQNRELINKLRNQVRQGSVKSEQMRKTLENLTQQLEEKDRQLKQLMAELEEKNVEIGELNTRVSDLSSNVKDLQEESSQKTQTIQSQDKQLNTAWFVYGTKKELKEQRIIEDGKVLRGNFNHDYFTKIDIRVDKEIRLYSRSAKLMTAHPADSYTLTQDANKQYVLRITNPQQFWSASKYLVVLVK